MCTSVRQNGDKNVAFNFSNKQAANGCIFSGEIHREMSQFRNAPKVLSCRK